MAEESQGMKTVTAILVLSAACLALVAATPEKPAKPPFEITTFTHSQLPGWFYSEGGKNRPAKCFKVGFKITSDGITSLDTTRVYLYNDKKELVHTFAKPLAEGKQLVGMSNVIATPSDLKKNTTYHLVYAYPAIEIQWKYALAVIGTKEVVVAECIPHSAKVEEFDFKEKEKLFGAAPAPSRKKPVDPFQRVGEKVF